MSQEADVVRALAAWALVHESADEEWKAAVERGQAAAPGSLAENPDAFSDVLAAAIFAEKERLKAALAEPGTTAPATPDTGAAIEELRFEVGELRGRLETMQATLDAIAAGLRTSGS